MGRVFVVEARRLFPLLFLLLLLISLSIYDNFRHQAAEPVFEPVEDEITLSVIDRGEVEDRFYVRVLYEKDDFFRVADEFALELPDYPFQSSEQVAVFIMNGELKKAQMVPLREGNQVRVTVDKARNSYDLATLDRVALENAGDFYWVFTDTKGNVLAQMPAENYVMEEEEEEEEDIPTTK